MKTLKLLCIGNSFSHDACKYLHDIAASDGVNTKIVNLFIGGCPLEKHSNNLKTNESEYDYELNGSTGIKKISIKDALCSDDWDFVVTQQASPESGKADTYYPYLTSVLDAIRKYAKNAKIFLHETWAYEIDSTHGAFPDYDKSQQKMYECLKNAYYSASEKEDLPLIISGDIIQYVRSLPEFDYANGGQTLCRDGFHMHEIFGRYLVGAVFYETVFGKSIKDNNFVPPTATNDDKKLLEIIKKAVHEKLNG